MTNDPISFSVITATWNCQSTISDCLNSVSEQSHPNIEHIVIDGASNDGTLEILNDSRDHFSKLLSEPDNGIYDALNKGINLASGDVVGFLHADDLYAHRDVLRDLAKVFTDSSVCAVYGDLLYVKKNDPDTVVRHWKSAPFSAKHLSKGWMPPHPTLYVRRDWYKKIGGFDTRYRIAADYFSILQLFSQPGFKAVYLPQVLVKMRTGGASNRSLRNIIRKSLEDFDALRRTKVGGVWALIWKNLSKLGQFFRRT